MTLTAVLFIAWSALCVAVGFKWGWMASLEWVIRAERDEKS